MSRALTFPDSALLIDSPSEPKVQTSPMFSVLIGLHTEAAAQKQGSRQHTRLISRPSFPRFKIR